MTHTRNGYIINSRDEERGTAQKETTMKKIEMARMIAADMKNTKADINVERLAKRLASEMLANELEKAMKHRGLNK